MNQEKIYGEYPGSFGYLADYLNNCKEHELYLIVSDILVANTKIREQLGTIKKGENYTPKSLVEELEKKLAEDTYAANYALAQTRRFGLNIALSPDNQPISIDGAVTKWAKWWNDYTNQKYSEIDRRKMTNLVKQGKSIPEFRPDGDWKENTPSISR